MKKRLDAGRQLLELRFNTLREENSRSHPQTLGLDQRGIVWLKNHSSVPLSSLRWCTEVEPLRALEKREAV